MEEFIQLGITAVFFVLFLGLGFFVGGWSERSHFASIRRRERAMDDMIATQSKQFLRPRPGGGPPSLIVAEVVVASDYLKTFAATLRNIFGGNVRSFETLLERARREATLRLLDQAREQGYNAICNLRLEAPNIGGMNRKGAAMATIIGTATAYHSEHEPIPPLVPE